ncbi:MAG: hypothetical protein LBV18_04590 [Alistipes sp.]|jgi:hypothetical protein|nr:hypothetical protein [Alistipes sp.]
MKKTLFTILLASTATLATLAAGTASAQTEPQTESREVKKNEFKKREYFNVNYAFQNLYGNPNVGDDVKFGTSDWGVGFTSGQSYILHRDPIAGMIHLGIDATWMDINVAHLNTTGPSVLGGGNSLYQADIALGIGLGAHVMPVDNIGVHTYVRYNPTLAMTSDFSSSISGGYASGLVVGAAFSYNLVQVGIEGRWGYGKYKNWVDGGAAQKMNTKGGRVYVGFRW